MCLRCRRQGDTTRAFGLQGDDLPAGLHNLSPARQTPSLVCHLHAAISPMSAGVASTDTRAHMIALVRFDICCGGGSRQLVAGHCGIPSVGVQQVLSLPVAAFPRWSLLVFSSCRALTQFAIKVLTSEPRQ